MGFEWRVSRHEVTVSFFLSLFLSFWLGCGLSCGWFAPRFCLSSASLFLVLLLSSSHFCLLFVSRVFAFYMAALVVACLCYFVPVITVLLRFSFLRSVCCRVVGVRVFVWKGCGSCGGCLSC